jgi:hypothetical protein
MAKKKKAKRASETINRRVDVAPEGGLLASCGFYAPQVQRVYKKWAKIHPPHLLEALYIPAAIAIIHEDPTLHPSMPPYVVSWPAYFELGKAISDVMRSKQKPAAWLLGGRWSCATNGKWANTQEIAKDIRQSGGPWFTPAAIRKAQERLKLTTPPHLAKSFLETWPNRPT